LEITCASFGQTWIEQEKRILGPRDSVFMPAGVVHATFNLGDEDATVLAILGPSVGEMGAENIDVSSEAPWTDQSGLGTTALHKGGSANYPDVGLTRARSSASSASRLSTRLHSARSSRASH
jgi:hypothetical protein